MSEPAADDFVNGSSFFGFMGVSLALVLASTYPLTEIWEQLMELPRQAPGLVVSPSGDRKW